jgi:AcrR family transcriptional regulator
MVRLVSAEDEAAKVPVSALCAEAGVSRPTFYRHFKSVDEVLAQAIEARLEVLGHSVPAEMDVSTGEPPEALVRIMTEVWRERTLYRQVLRSSSPYAQAKQTAQSWVEQALASELGTAQRANTRVVFAAGGVLAFLAMLVESDDLDEAGMRTVVEEFFTIMTTLKPKSC